MKLLLTGAFRYSEEQISEIENMGHTVVFVNDERASLAEQHIRFNVNEIEGVICNGLFLNNDIRDFTHLRYIQLTSAGFDRVPMDYITAHDITIHNARGVYSIPMAEWALGKVLEIYKHSRSFYDSQCGKQWRKDRNLTELYGKTVCVVGVGSVGSEVVKLFSAMGCHTIGVDVYTSKITDEAYMINDINEALAKSDVIVLTVPLTEQTNHMVDKGRLAVMRDDAVLVNVSRGGIIKEHDLIESLREGRFRGVALDVFEEEPLSESNPLWGMPNVIVTPHNSFVSDRNNERLFDVIIKNLKKVEKEETH